MALRPLGKTGLMVSAVGLGTTKLGRNEQVKYPRPFELPADAEVKNLFDAARQLGINLIDTAPAYGEAEQRIGALLPRPDEWVVVTKVGETFESGRSAFDFSDAAIRASVARSARRLRRRTLDLVLLHCDDDDERLIGDGTAIETLAALRGEGRIKAIGASTKTVAAGLLAVARCDVVMVTLNRTDQSQRPVVDAARRAGKGVLVKKTLASGHDPAPSQALAEVVQTPGVSAAIVGTIDADHLRETCSAVKMTHRP